MAELFLVRHGQAAFGHDNYDQLSDLGKQQAIWVGEHFAEKGLEFDRVITGTQHRHHQTAEGIAKGMGKSFEFEQFAGLNEYDFQGLVASRGADHPAAKSYMSGDRKAFFKAFNLMLQQWSRNELEGDLPEQWREFYQRVADGLAFATTGAAKRVLVVSSGGVMGTIAGMVMKSPPDVGIALNLLIRNCSLSHYYFTPDSITLSEFNSVSHFDRPDKRHAITFG